MLKVGRSRSEQATPPWKAEEAETPHRFAPRPTSTLSEDGATGGRRSLPVKSVLDASYVVVMGRPLGSPALCSVILLSRDRAVPILALTQFRVSEA